MGTKESEEMEAYQWFIGRIFLPILCAYSLINCSSRKITENKFETIIQAEIHKPTKEDSIKFYYSHGLADYVKIANVPKDSIKKYGLEKYITLKEIPYSEKKRIVDESK